MDRQDELAIIRAAYAKQILALAEIDDIRLDAAFAAVRREDFLGPGPWPMLRRFEGRWYVPTPDADPVYLYTNDLVGIVPERHLNNGQPSLHAHLIHQATHQHFCADGYLLLNSARNCFSWQPRRCWVGLHLA